ncbi:MAG: protein kinase [Actinomycetia bacterium]|nr:protein kinase [Actinomycetes bacterium]
MNDTSLIANRYKIIKKIASGGMADVFLGQDSKLDRQVAIKILSENYARNKSFVARFKREAQILAKLNHPNIVMIYDWGQHNGSYFICMEYIEGYSLKEIIERRGIISPQEAAKYAIQICQALEAAHSNNLIHRDIKPQNILVTADNTLKVTDFGIAKQALDDATKTMNIIGTANYISPEQAMGKSLDHRSDIYSLGVVLYEMITADLPFRGESSVDISLKHINEIPARPSLMVQDVPLALEKIVMHCLQKDRETRYSTVSQLKKDLFRYLEGRKLSIEQPSKRRQQKRPFFFKKVMGPLRIADIFFISISLILAVVAAIFIFGYVKDQDDSKPFLMPNLAGQNFQTAQTILEHMEIEVEASYQFHHTISEDSIISQIPSANSALSEEDSVRLVVSRGSQQRFLSVPNLLGLTREQVSEVLEDMGLEEGQIDKEVSSNLFAGKVIGQSPAFNQQIEEGGTVDLVLGEGPQMVVIPNIVGTDYPYAASHLQSLGLTLDAEIATRYGTSPGTVVDTVPAPGNTVESNSIIKILIATNQELATVPDLNQMELSRAIEALSSVALNYEVKEVSASYSVQKGLVMSQFPRAGSSVFLNSTVIIFVGS